MPGSSCCHAGRWPEFLKLWSTCCPVTSLIDLKWRLPAGCVSVCKHIEKRQKALTPCAQLIHLRWDRWGEFWREGQYIRDARHKEGVCVSVCVFYVSGGGGVIGLFLVLRFTNWGPESQALGIWTPALFVPGEDNDSQLSLFIQPKKP